MHWYNPLVYTESPSLKFCTSMIKKQEASQRCYANLNESKVASYSDTMNKIWSGRVSIIILGWNFICLIYWQKFNDLNSGIKYTLGKFKGEIMDCSPEEPRQAGEMGWQELRAKRQSRALAWGGTTYPHWDVLRVSWPAGQRTWRPAGQEDMEILVDHRGNMSQWCALAVVHTELHEQECSQQVDESDNFPVFNTLAAGFGRKFWASQY